LPPNVAQGVSAPPKGMHGGEKVGGPCTVNTGWFSTTGWTTCSK